MSYRWSTLTTRSAATLALVASLTLAAACSEKLDSSASCPIGCSGETSEVLTTTLDGAVAIDTAVQGGLGLGTEALMLLASRGDSLDTRVIIRFDSLPQRIPKSASDTTSLPINGVDSVKLHFRLDSAAALLADTSSISIYDVSAAVNDTAAADLAAQMIPANLIAVRQANVGSLADTLSVDLPASVILTHIQTATPLRIGFRVSSSRSVTTRVFSAGTGSGPTITAKFLSDTTSSTRTVTPFSKTPTNKAIASALADFSVVVSGQVTPSPELLAVGGLPARRTYFRFNIPRRYLDSAIVIRATLLLTQAPSPTLDGADTMPAFTLLGVATPTVTNPTQAAAITSNTLTPMDTLKVLTSESKQIELEVAPAFRAWAAQADSLLTRAIVLQAVRENSSPQQMLFYSTEAVNPAFRPQLRISYTLRSRIGTP